jgi:hypothetical protein
MVGLNRESLQNKMLAGQRISAKEQTADKLTASGAERAALV